jgi:hypothetical protein
MSVISNKVKRLILIFFTASVMLNLASPHAKQSEAAGFQHLNRFRIKPA